MKRFNRDLALLYGVMLGDGCLSRGKKAFFISICGHMKDDVNFFEKIEGIITKIRGKETKYRFRKNQGKIEYNFSDKKLFSTFKDLGFPVGKKGPELKIPSRLPDRLLIYAIRGYFATDGSVVLANNNGTLYPRLEIKSISKVLVCQVQSFLEKYEIPAKIYLTKVADGQDIYRLQVNGYVNGLKFHDCIGFYNPKHETRFLEYKKCRWRDSSPRPSSASIRGSRWPS